MKQNKHESLLPKDDMSLIAEVEAMIQQSSPIRPTNSLHRLYSQMVDSAPTPHLEFEQQLYEQLTAYLQQKIDEEETMAKTKRFWHKQPRWAAAVVMTLLVICFGLIWASPAMRVRAQAILAQVGLFVLTDEPTLMEQTLAETPEPITPEPPPSDALQPISASSLDEAREQSDFPIFTPGYVPEGYELNQPQAYELFCCHDGETNEVATTYFSPEGQYLIMIRQIRSATDSTESLLTTFPIGDASVVDVNVRGQEGIWVDGSLQGSHQNEDGTRELTAWNILLWQEDEFLFWIYNNGLSMDEAVKLAESLAP